MEKTYRVPFAYDAEGNMVDYISAVKGVHYKCECGKKVALRGGDKVSPHLYHIEPTECNGESLIHKAYKNAFERVKAVKLPYVVNGSDSLEFDRIEIEKKFQDIIPDAIGYIGDVPYFIEFAHTSFIKERKLNKIKQANVFCLEISICTSYDRLDQIKDHIKKLTTYKEIVHVPEYKEMIELREKFIIEWKGLKKENHLLSQENQLLKSKIDEINRTLSDFRGETIFALDRCGEKLRNLIHRRA
jgi:trehalose-6-phosphate synthase